MPQYSCKDNSVTIYLNNIAHIKAFVSLGNQEEVIQITGIAPNFLLETLHPVLGSRSAEILEAQVLEPTTLAEIAKSQVGKEVNDSQTSRSVRVLGVDGNNLLVYGETGTYAKKLTDFVYYDVNKRMSEKAVELQLKNLSTNELMFSYLTEGITLTPHYNFVLSKGKLVLEAEVKVVNRTGKSFDGVELEAIPGDIRTPYLIRGESPRIKEVATDYVDSLLTEFADGDIGVFEEAGQIGYFFGRRNLPEGESKFSIFKTKELDCVVVYKANLQGKRPKINTVLNFKTPITLPVGSVAVYGEKPGRDKEKTIERYEGGGSIENPVLKDENVNIALRTPDTLEMKVNQIGNTEIVKTAVGIETTPSSFALEREFEVVVNNAGQENVTIETYLILGEKLERLLTTDLTAKEEGRKIRWDVAAKAGEKASFRYKTQDLQFRQMSYGEVRDSLGRGEMFGNTLI